MAIFIKKITYLCPFFYLFLTVPTTSTNHPYEPKWECKTIPDIRQNCKQIISNRPYRHPHSEVVIHPFYACVI